jgi:hypothetical protein
LHACSKRIAAGGGESTGCLNWGSCDESGIPLTFRKFVVNGDLANISERTDSAKGVTFLFEIKNSRGRPQYSVKKEILVLGYPISL